MKSAVIVALFMVAATKQVILALLLFWVSLAHANSETFYIFSDQHGELYEVQLALIKTAEDADPAAYVTFVSRKTNVETKYLYTLTWMSCHRFDPNGTLTVAELTGPDLSPATKVLVRWVNVMPDVVEGKYKNSKRRYPRYDGDNKLKRANVISTEICARQNEKVAADIDWAATNIARRKEARAEAEAEAALLEKEEKFEMATPEPSTLLRDFAAALGKANNDLKAMSPTPKWTAEDQARFDAEQKRVTEPSKPSTSGGNSSSSGDRRVQTAKGLGNTESAACADAKNDATDWNYKGYNVVKMNPCECKPATERLTRCTVDFVTQKK